MASELSSNPAMTRLANPKPSPLLPASGSFPYLPRHQLLYCLTQKGSKRTQRHRSGWASLTSTEVGTTTESALLLGFLNLG